MGGNHYEAQEHQRSRRIPKVSHTCTGDVYLKSQDGDVFNLKSALSEYIALGQLLSEQGDNLELFADKREDEAKLISFLAELDKENGEA